MSDQVSQLRVEGDVFEWAVGGVPRRFLNLTLPFGQCERMFDCTTFNARTGLGEQRVEADAHVRKLSKAMDDGTFTPTGVTAQTRESHRAAIEWLDGRARLALAAPLPLTNGQHRFAAVRRILARLDKQGDAAAAARVRAAPVPVLVLLDGCPKRDFLRLQMGKAVDPATLLSMRILTGDLPGRGGAEAMRAMECARLLHADPDSPFNRAIKFDSRGTAGLPITSLCARGGSDLSFSLVGLARACPDPLRAAAAVVHAAEAVREHAPGAMGDGQCLEPPPDGGRGQATLLVGVAIGLDHMARVRGEWPPSPETLAAVGAAAAAVFDRPVAGNLSGPAKRGMMGAYLVELFAGTEGVEMHDDIPLELLKLVPPSAVGADPLPRPKPKRKGRAACA
jgi:hypothetical protein